MRRMTHHSLILVSIFTFSILFYSNSPNKKRVEFKAPLDMPQQPCEYIWCSHKNEFVLPSALIALVEQLQVKTTVYKRDAYIEATMSNYLQSTKFKYIGVDVKGHHGIILLNYYVKSVWAGLMTKRELLVNQLLLPTPVPVKKLKGPMSIVSSVAQLFKNKDMITSIDPNIPMDELNVPILQIPPNMANLLLNYIVFESSVLPRTLINTIQLYQQVLSNPSLYTISIKLHDRSNFKCIDKLVKQHSNPVLYVSGNRKLVRKLQLKYYYRNITVLTTIPSKFLQVMDTRVDWTMLHDFISLHANQLVSNLAIKKEFEPFLNQQIYTTYDTC